jgi:hypothetical protein
MKFKLGDKVKCINDPMVSTYTVREFISYRKTVPCNRNSRGVKSRSEYVHMYFLEGVDAAINEDSLEHDVVEMREDVFKKLGI